MLLKDCIVLQAGRKHIGEQFEIFHDESGHPESMPKQRLATQVQHVMLACVQLYLPASSFALLCNDASSTI